MAKLIIVLLVALFFEAIGVVFLSKGIKEIGALKEPNVAGVVSLVGRAISNPHVLAGVFFEALFFIGLLYLISQADVSFVWPLTSLSFVVTTLAAKIYLHEHVSAMRWSGVCLIMLGAALITLTEKAKKPEGHPGATTAASERALLPH
jgi:drug/metabolite transporter (DMT)-like permease